ncbi:hypothetical protein EA462_15305 [Natrarchaeobius halalkaliphilus]|uniref:DUF3784 domain-containing protein n=1 Tax=Natrarchaeobius halalkaliphilus TaxID=1679091 RepID=A0A3N6NUV4_9EURY|nr:hypothetical protein [Natrarchaeobius halalkaliphilus]RQG87010.1 hypothetical protein EA462_15305 [Natrarchaeobius halalkaliphilus]
MIDPNYIGAAVWFVCGLAILGLGYLIGVHGRADLHADYDESVDPTYASRWIGVTAVVMGLLVIGYAVREAIYGFHPYALGGLVLTLLVLSYVTKLFARGFGSRG